LSGNDAELLRHGRSDLLLWGGIKMRLLGALVLVFMSGVAGAAPAETPLQDSAFPEKTPTAPEIHTDELMQLLNDFILIDVSDLSARPGALSRAAVPAAPPHQDITGSVWMPGVGAAVLDTQQNDSFLEGLETLTNDDPGQPIVFYGHAKGQDSLRAAMRAVGLGYRSVYWYPDGVEGWRNAGHVIAAPKTEMNFKNTHF
jgi:PQQ-dependent catabolism-associated CXXCW motif protein